MPTSAPTGILQAEVHEGIKSLQERILGNEESPLGQSVSRSVEASISNVASAVFVQHGLGRVPTGAILVGCGVPGQGIETDVIMTLDIPGSSSKTAKLWFQRAVGAAATTRTYFFLLL
jgi:hypothetical protein